MVKSAYIHIPFCKSKCHYCSFVSYTDTSSKDAYIKALANEIKFYYDGEMLKTIYFGGGTPSLLGVAEFQKILRLLNFSETTELTVELNPDDVSYDYLRGLYDIGINRLSYGCQTFNDEILKYINRRHTGIQVVEAVNNARNAGFKNVSLDFIYGLPQQSCEMFEQDLQKAVKLGVEHLSLYGLTIEKGCYFYDKGETPPDEDEQADMYLKALEILQNNGYEHYEISNFAKDGLYSRHNMNYWNNAEYYGFGVAAHGYKNRTRYGNLTVIADYLDNPTEREQEKFLNDQEILEEEIFLGFRRVAGIDIKQINTKFNMDFEEKYNNVIKKYEGMGFMCKTKNGYALTPNGILVSNTILADFLV